MVISRFIICSIRSERNYRLQMKEKTNNIDRSRFADEETLSAIAKEFGTPVYIVNPSILEDEFRRISGCFSERGIDLKIFYSVKTNPLPVALKRIFDLGGGVEIVNDYELQLVDKFGFPPERIIVNGGAKSEKLFRDSIAKGFALICLENIDEVKSVDNIARRLGVRRNVSLRIKPKLRRNPFDFTLLASSGGYSGFADPNELASALTFIKNSEFLKLKGFNFHLGTNIKSAAPFKNAISQILKIYKMAWEKGHEPEIIDIGGGFGFNSIHTINLLEAFKIYGLRKKPKSNSHTSQGIIPAVAEHLSNEIQKLKLNRTIKEPAIFIEPGRALTAACQALLLEVTDAQPGKPGRVHCNGGAMSLSPLLLAEIHDVTNLSASNKNAYGDYDIMGNLPTPLDVVATGKRILKISKGDILAVWDTGAYFASLGNNFAGPRPAVVLLDDNKIKLIKRRETVEDILGGDY